MLASSATQATHEMSRLQAPQSEATGRDPDGPTLPKEETDSPQQGPAGLQSQPTNDQFLDATDSWTDAHVDRHGVLYEAGPMLASRLIKPLASHDGQRDWFRETLCESGRCIGALKKTRRDLQRRGRALKKRGGFLRRSVEKGEQEVHRFFRRGGGFLRAGGEGFEEPCGGR